MSYQAPRLIRFGSAIRMTLGSGSEAPDTANGLQV